MTPFLMNDLRARVDLCVSKIMHWALNIDEEGGCGVWGIQWSLQEEENNSF